MKRANASAATISMNDVTRRLEGLRRIWAMIAFGGGLLRWIAWAGFAFGIAVLLSRVAPVVVRPALLLAWAAVAVSVAYREFVKPARRFPSRETVAGRVEDAYPSARQRLLSAVQFHEQRDAMETLGYDVRLMKMTIDAGAQTLAGFRSTRVWGEEWKRAKTSALFAAIAAASVALLYGAGWLTPTHARDWIASPQASIAWDFGAISPGDTTIHRGEDLTVRAELTGNAPSAATLDARELGGEWQEIPMRQVQGAREAVARSVVEPMEYRVRAKGKTSEIYRVDVATPPIVEALAVTLRFPAYSGLGVKALEPNQGDITALVGTRVEVTGASATALSKALLDFASLDDAPLHVDGRAFSGEFIVKNSGRYSLLLTGEDGLPNAHPPEFIVYAVEDGPPTVAVLQPGENTTLDRTMTLGVEVEALDDFGVSSVTLQYRHDQQEHEGSELLRRFSEETPMARVSHMWDLSQLDLFPDDTVSYYVEVFDNDTLNGPKRAVSPTYVVRFPSMSEMFNDMKRSQQTQTEALQAMRDANDEANDIIDGLIDRMRTEHELTLRDHKDIEKAMQLQEEVERQRSQLVEEMTKALRKSQENQLLSVDTLQKVAEMQRLMDEVASEELKEAMRKLQQALESQTMEQRQQELMAAEFDQKKFQERIDQMIQMLEQLRRKQELEKAHKMAEALTARQKEVVEQTEEINRSLGERQPEAGSEQGERSSLLGERERRIGDESEALNEQIRTAADALAEDEDLRRVANDLEKLMADAERGRLRENLSDAGEKLASRNPQSAQQPATQALQQLQMMTQALDNALEFMESQGGEALMNAMRDSMRQTLYLSQEHERLFDQADQLNRRRTRAGNQNDGGMDELALDEKTVAEGVNAVSEELRELSAEETQIPLEIMWALRDAAYAVDRSSMAFAENELDRALPIQREALGALNQSALKMLETLNALNAQMGSSGMENMLDRLQQLAEGQGDLNQLAEQIEQMMREQGQSPGMEQTMQRMAFEQSLIRQAFGRLEEQMRRMDEALGELGGTGEEMENVEGRLEASELNRDLLERMRRIETRMLESAKSLEKRQTGKSRKAQIAERIFGDQIGTENEQWSQVEELFKGELGDMGELEAPEKYRSLIRAYYRALADTRPAENPSR